MKNIFFLSTMPLLISLFLIPNGVAAQWTDISPTSASNVHFFDVEFASENVGFAVGQNIGTKVGYIYKTTDGGESWSSESFPNAHLRTVAYTNENTWIVAGYDGPPGTEIIWIRTSDQGENWSSSTDTRFKGINSIQFTDENTGFAIGYGSEFGTNAGILRTIDGGATWTLQYDGVSTIAGGAHFWDRFTGYIAFTDLSASGYLTETNDGGVTHTTFYTGDWMHDVWMHKDGTGYVLEGLGSKSVVKTTSLGGSWETPQSVDDKASAIEFISPSGGYLIGESGFVAKTVNGAGSWTDESPGATGKFEQLSVNGEYAYICSSNGEMYRTKHGITLSAKKTEPGITRVSLFPNPVETNGVLKINGRLDRETLFTLRDLSGRELLKSKVEANQISLSKTPLKAGMYVYHLESSTQQTTGKILLR